MTIDDKTAEGCIAALCYWLAQYEMIEEKPPETEAVIHAFLKFYWQQNQPTPLMQEWYETLERSGRIEEAKE